MLNPAITLIHYEERKRQRDLEYLNLVYAKCLIQLFPFLLDVF